MPPPMIRALVMVLRDRGSVKGDSTIGPGHGSRGRFAQAGADGAGGARGAGGAAGGRGGGRGARGGGVGRGGGGGGPRRPTGAGLFGLFEQPGHPAVGE